MKRVITYNQYGNIYSDNQNNYDLVILTLPYYEPVDTNRYTLVHEGSGFTVTEGDNLTESDAISLVTNLYEQAKTIGTSYTEKSIKLNEGYAELSIVFADGKRLNKVIYTEDVL